MDEPYARPDRAEVAARVRAEMAALCPSCGHGRRTLGHFWACVRPVLEARDD